MDANTSTAGQSFAAAQSESKPETKNRDVTVVIDTTHTTGKHVTTNVQTLNGNTVVEFGTASVESSRKNSQPFVNNGSIWFYTNSFNKCAKCSHVSSVMFKQCCHCHIPTTSYANALHFTKRRQLEHSVTITSCHYHQHLWCRRAQI